MNTGLPETLLWHDLEIFLLIGALLGIALGLLLIFRPQFLERVNRLANRWISLRHVTLQLDRSISIERWCMRHHRSLGILLTLGAGYVLIYFGWLFDKALALRLLAVYFPGSLLDWLLSALVSTSLLGGAVSMFVGLLLWLRPGLLRGIDRETDQWVSSRHALKPLEVQHNQVDRYVAQHARPVGWVLLMGSVYLLAAMFYLLL